MKFKKIFHQAIQESKNQLQPNDYNLLVDVATKPVRIHRLTNQPIDLVLRVRLYVYRRLQGRSKIDWKVILEFIKTHWKEILKLLMSLLLMVI